MDSCAILKVIYINMGNTTNGFRVPDCINGKLLYGKAKINKIIIILSK
jgi:hypothetical protein